MLQDPLRRRFSNALHWYSCLKESVKSAVDDVVYRCRVIGRGQDEKESEISVDHNAVDGDSREDGRKRTRRNIPDRLRPSDYLRSRCPLCFGGPFPDVNHQMKYVPSLCRFGIEHSLLVHSFDALVCLDACFTQKHNKAVRDPLKRHPDSLFLSEEELHRAESYVESLRPSKSKAVEDADIVDGFEGPLKVPNSALNGCEASFVAADERREKASTQFFDCTGIMGLLCRHDRVLWLANMTSAGEKQFYVIALLQKLFEHLPSEYRVGVLYDIGCQLHRSCIKWNFLGEFLDRLGFAISVFHAFGHCWACQLIYHPRKAEGFGFSDGEGCERFWHSISRLIPYLRVCGVSRTFSYS
jgi:hypothetical protein